MFRYANRLMPMVEIITNKTDPRCIEIYRLRHTVVIDQHKMKINQSNIYESTSGKVIMDNHDISDATVHYAIRNPATGKIVSAIRTIDANKTKLDMEKHNWFQIDPKIKAGGVVEWSRLVSDASVRKTNLALTLYIKSVDYQQDLGVNNVIFMVDSRAKNLMNYYNRYTICEEISNGPVACNEYEQGRMSHVMLMPMGEAGSIERVKFTAQVRIPIMVAVSLMKSV
jgi:N-acyl-L-homoserine lactone synthetase